MIPIQPIIYLQVKCLEERVEELTERLAAATRATVSAERRASAAQVGVGSRDSYERRIDSLIRRLEYARKAARLDVDRVCAERDHARAELLKQFARRPDMTATEVLLRQERALAEARVANAERVLLDFACRSVNAPVVFVTPPPAGTYFWLGSHGDA